MNVLTVLVSTTLAVGPVVAALATAAAERTAAEEERAWQAEQRALGVLSSDEEGQEQEEQEEHEEEAQQSPRRAISMLIEQQEQEDRTGDQLESVGLREAGETGRRRRQDAVGAELERLRRPTVAWTGASCFGRIGHQSPMRNGHGVVNNIFGRGVQARWSSRYRRWSGARCRRRWWTSHASWSCRRPARWHFMPVSTARTP